jgi:hypothetical protein
MQPDLPPGTPIGTLKHTTIILTNTSKLNLAQKDKD